MHWLYGLIIGLMWLMGSVITFLVLRYNWKNGPLWLFAALAVAAPPCVLVLQFGQH